MEHESSGCFEEIKTAGEYVLMSLFDTWLDSTREGGISTLIGVQWRDYVVLVISIMTL